MPMAAGITPMPETAENIVDRKQDTCAMAEEVREQVWDMQSTLGTLTLRIAKLHGAIRLLDCENRRLREENMELQVNTLNRPVLPGNAAFAGTGEMPQTPRDTPLAWIASLDEGPPAGEGEANEPRGGAPAHLLLEENQSFGPAAGPDKSEPCPTESTSAQALTKKRRGSVVGLVRSGSTSALAYGPDLLEMKEQVRRAVTRPQYDVTDFYLTTGIFQYVARSAAFEYVTMGVIFVNAIWIAVDVELNTEQDLTGASGDGPTAVFSMVANHLFCVYFLLELVIRFMAFEQKRNCFRDAWFSFDFALVTLMVAETWILPLVFSLLDGATGGFEVGDTTLLRMLRLLRITRVGRMVKLLRAVPELIIVIKGIGVAIRSVMYTWLLMVGVIYVFAIAFRQILYGTPLGEKYFSGVLEAMYTLLLRGTLPDLADFMLEVGNESVVAAVALMTFILLVTLTVMNMLIGVLVDVVGVVSKVENYELQVAFVKQKLLAMLDSTGLDEDGNQRISRNEFANILINPQAAKILQDLGVDPVGLVDFMDFIFKDMEELDFPTFMDVILQLRGSNTATVRDIVDFRKWMVDEFHKLESNIGVPARHTSRRLSRGGVLIPSDLFRGEPELKQYTIQDHGKPWPVQPASLASQSTRAAWSAQPSSVLLASQATSPKSTGLRLDDAIARSSSVITASNGKQDDVDLVKPLSAPALPTYGAQDPHAAHRVGHRRLVGGPAWRVSVEDDVWDEEV